MLAPLPGALKGASCFACTGSLALRPSGHVAAAAGWRPLRSRANLGFEPLAVNRLHGLNNFELEGNDEDKHPQVLQ